MESGRLVGGWDHQDPSPVVVAASFRSVAGAVAVPRPFAEGVRDVVTPGDAERAADVDAVALGHRQDVAEGTGLQVTA